MRRLARACRERCMMWACTGKVNACRIAYCSSTHITVRVCVCVCVCASVQCMYRVHNGLPLHKKSYGTQCICMYRRPFLYIPWTLHAAICTCTDQCAVKGGSIENHSYENSTCTESCQRNTVSFTQCAYMHKSVGVWFECSSVNNFYAS